MRADLAVAMTIFGIAIGYCLFIHSLWPALVIIVIAGAWWYVTA